MIDGIRRFKGTRAGPQVQSEVNISIDGSFDDWDSVYYDHAVDIRHRNSTGWGRIEAYRDTSGQYDLLEVRVEREGDWLAFYLRIDQDFPDGKLPAGMELLLTVEGGKLRSNLNYTHRIIPGEPQVIVAQAPEAGTVYIQKARGKWQWDTVGHLPASTFVSGNELEFQVSLSLLGNPPVNFNSSGSTTSTPTAEAS